MSHRNLNLCISCSAIAQATDRKVEEHCPGHKNANEIAALAGAPEVATDVVLHTLLGTGPKAFAAIEAKFGIPVKTVRAIARASADWHATLAS